MALADALVAKLQDEPFNAHVEQVSEMQIEHAVAGGPPEGSTIQLGGSIDISGDDLRMLSTTTVPGIGTWDSEIVVLGDDAWTRLYPGAALTRTTRGHVVAMIDGLVEEFRPIDDPGLLRYVGLETIDGQELHHLAAPANEVPYHAGTYDSLDFYVLGDGTPVLTKGSFTSADDSGQVGRGTVTLAYSGFGTPVTIEPPSSGS